MYSISLKMTPKTKKFLDEFPTEFNKALYKGVRKALLYAEAESKKSFGKLGHLKIGTGHLRRSIKGSVKKRFDKIVAQLSSDVIYAGIHEHGGVIRARNAPYLKFTVGDRWVQVKQVTMPKRAFLEPAISENLTEMEKVILDTIEVETK